MHDESLWANLVHRKEHSDCGTGVGKQGAQSSLDQVFDIG